MVQTRSVLAKEDNVEFGITFTKCTSNFKKFTDSVTYVNVTNWLRNRVSVKYYKPRYHINLFGVYSVAITEMTKTRRTMWGYSVDSKCYKCERHLVGGMWWRVMV